MKKLIIAVFAAALIFSSCETEIRDGRSYHHYRGYEHEHYPDHHEVYNHGYHHDKDGHEMGDHH
jgi:hypothetical protein